MRLLLNARLLIMSKTEHTPGPWVANELRSPVYGSDGSLVDARIPVYSEASSHPICFVGELRQSHAAANARRIVACVNACEGIDPDEIPAAMAALAVQADAADAMSIAEAQRDALLAALREMVDTLADFERFPQGRGYSLSERSLAAFISARAAIRAAEGEKS